MFSKIKNRFVKISIKVKDLVKNMACCNRKPYQIYIAVLDCPAIHPRENEGLMATSDLQFRICIERRGIRDDEDADYIWASRALTRTNFSARWQLKHHRLAASELADTDVVKLRMRYYVCELLPRHYSEAIKIIKEAPLPSSAIVDRFSWCNGALESLKSTQHLNLVFGDVWLQMLAAIEAAKTHKHQENAGLETSNLQKCNMP